MWVKCAVCELCIRGIVPTRQTDPEETETISGSQPGKLLSTVLYQPLWLWFTCMQLDRKMLVIPEVPCHGFVFSFDLMCLVRTSCLCLFPTPCLCIPAVSSVKSSLCFFLSLCQIMFPNVSNASLAFSAVQTFFSLRCRLSSFGPCVSSVFPVTFVFFFFAFQVFFLGFCFVAFSSPTVYCLHFEFLDTALVNRACFMFPNCVRPCLHLGPHILQTLTVNVNLSMRIQFGLQFKKQPANYSVMLSCRSTAGNCFLFCLGLVVAIRPEVCA